MTESENPVSNQESASDIEQSPWLIDILGASKLNSKQRLAVDILDGSALEVEQQKLIFFFHLFSRSGSIDPIKKFTTITNEEDILKMVGEVIDDDNLTKEYDRFYNKYKKVKSDRK